MSNAVIIPVEVARKIWQEQWNKASINNWDNWRHWQNTVNDLYKSFWRIAYTSVRDGMRTCWPSKPKSEILKSYYTNNRSLFL